MRVKLALAGLLAGVAATVAPVAPASAYCAEQLIVIDDGGGSGQCTNGCYETGEAYENATASLREQYPFIPSYWDLFACLD